MATEHKRDIVSFLRPAASALRQGECVLGLPDALDEAAVEIVRLRSTLWELSACVQGAEKRKEAVRHAQRLAPLPSIGTLMLHQFHKTDMLWGEGGSAPW